MREKHPFLIVGGGLAGMAVAWQLWQRGAPFVLVDPDKAETCSKIAAGLITPITGMRLNVSSRLAELLPVARGFYRQREELLGVRFHHEVPLVRLLKSEREQSIWKTRQQESEATPWVDTSASTPLVDDAVFHAELGGFQQRHSGWLDTAAYLRESRSFFTNLGCVISAEVRDAELEHGTDAIHWRDTPYRAVVLCRGAEERRETRYFPWLEWDCARGVIARLEADFHESRIINRGCWLLPREGGWRCGSTYEFDFEAPIEASLEKLRVKLQGLLKVPFELTSAHAAIRPILKQKRLSLGPHPGHPRILLFNGLGSKGSLQAPFFSQMLVDHLLDDRPLDETVDVAANA